MNRGSRLTPWLPFAVLLFLGGCSGDTEPGLSKPSYEVAERFEVGSGIYVRALAIEDATNTLWVGTSMGVMEIGLG